MPGLVRLPHAEQTVLMCESPALLESGFTGRALLPAFGLGPHAKYALNLVVALNGLKESELASTL